MSTNDNSLDTQLPKQISYEAWRAIYGRSVAWHVAAGSKREDAPIGAQPGTAYLNCVGRPTPAVGARLTFGAGTLYQIIRVDEFRPPRVSEDGTRDWWPLWAVLPNA